MKRKIVSGMVISLLLTGLLISAFNIQIVRAEASYIDVTILNLTASPTTVFVGDVISIDIFVEVTAIDAHKNVAIWTWYNNKAIGFSLLWFSPGFTGHFTHHTYHNWVIDNIEPGSYIVSANVTGDDDPAGNEYTFGTVTVLAPIKATIDINPETLNLRSNGKWITAYIELPKAYNVSRIDVDSVWLNHNWFGTGARQGGPQDDVFMVKFGKRHLIWYLKFKGIIDIEVTLTISGKLNDATFEGSDTIRVIG